MPHIHRCLVISEAQWSGRKIWRQWNRGHVFGTSGFQPHFSNPISEHATAGGFLPPIVTNSDILLNIYLLEKALYELGYELNNRPDWVRIPLAGILQLLEAPVLEAPEAA